MKIPKLKYGTAIEVRWRDTSGSGGWAHLHEEPLTTVTLNQLGYYIAHDADTLWIAGGIPEEDSCQILAPTAFPIGCVEAIRKVKV